ncbi:unnamed protein product [Linum trigynum]|uniref:Uncharacterized protein n=1 Tax=Linum trigynum TaxID=586398 RepID=A0AAV2G7T5_9ROSI
MQHMNFGSQLGMSSLQLSRDASAAGAARGVTKQNTDLEIESVEASRKSEVDKLKKHFRVEVNYSFPMSQLQF